MTKNTNTNASNKGFFIEPIGKVDRDIYIRLWLDGDISTEDFEEFLARKVWLVEYR